LDNSTGETPTFSYVGAGIYKIVFAQTITTAKTFYEITQRNDTYYASVNFGGSPSGYVLSTKSQASNTYTDGILIDNPIEIRIYP
jgi:hypothetical protein